MEAGKIKAAIIGLGKMGISHCSICNAHPDVDLLAVCDSSSFVLEAFRKYTPKLVYTDFAQMLDENQLDAVIVSTPTRLHRDMVSYALDKGLNVFCEKPFALAVRDGEELARLAEQKRVVNQVGYHNRFIATFQEAKRLLNRKVIGEIEHFSGEAYGPVVTRPKGGTWRSERKNGGGCLYDYSSHVIDLVHYLLGSTTGVRGTVLKKFYSDSVEDGVYSILMLKSGLSGTLSVNWSDETYRKMSTSITIWGKEGKIIVDALELKVYLKRDNDAEELRKGWNVKYVTDLTTPVSFYLRGEEYSAQIDYFVKHVKEKELENVNSFESAAETDNTIELLIRDAEDL